MSTAPARRRATAALLLAAALAVTGRGQDSAGPRAPARSVDYLAGRAADTWLPRRMPQATTPVVLLLPGGSWQTADPTGLRPLAAWLARHGVPAVTATYRAAGDGVLMPDAIADIRCAAAYAGAAAGRPGRPRPVVLLGHSSGAHLAALAALAPGSPPATCRYPAPEVVGLVGLSGPYYVRGVADLLEPLVGASPAADPAAWAAADPLRLAARPPTGLAVLLVHGTADPVVPPGQSRLLADRLRASGVDVTLRMVRGADHDSIYTAAVAGPRVLQWLAAHS